MSFFSRSKYYLSSLLDLIYPETCYACDSPLLERETCVCVFCQHNLFDLHQESDRGDIFLKRFSEQPVDSVTGLMRYQKLGASQELVNKVKYHAELELGEYLGKELGRRLKKTQAIDGVDYIIAVPLHKKKLKKRGYNQAQVLAEGISEVIEKPVLNGVLGKVLHNQTQTKRSRLSRWKNTEMAYEVKASEGGLEGKRVLLVDDVLTSGATLTSCNKVLREVGVETVDVAVLAVAVMN